MHFFEPHRSRFFGAALPILVGSVIYSGTLHLLRLSALSCIDVVVPSEVQLLLLVIPAALKGKMKNLLRKKLLPVVDVGSSVLELIYSKSH